MSRNLRALVMAGCASLLVACAGSQDTGRTFSIPENGVIAAARFADIKDRNDIALFNGSDGEIAYQWVFSGESVKDPHDANLGISFTHTAADKVKTALGAAHVLEFAFDTTEPIDGDPSLTIYLPEPWNAGGVDVYRHISDSEPPEVVASATLENSPNAVLTFSPRRYDGLMHLAGRPASAPGSNPASAPPSSPAGGGGKGGAAPDPYVSGEGGSGKGGAGKGDAGKGGAGKDGKAKHGSSKTNPPKRKPGQDKYLTDPIPPGKPKPVEPGDVPVDHSKQHSARLSIRADTILSHLDQFNKDKLPVLPSDGVLMPARNVVFSEGESVFDVLKRETRAAKVHMEFSWYAIYNSVYVEGIGNLYEFDCGPLSGWMYKVNGWFPNYGASRYTLKQGDAIEWVYTCDLGRDVGGYFPGMVMD